VFNATVIPLSLVGYMAMWPSHTAAPWVSTLNAIDGTTTSNMAIVPDSGFGIVVFVSHPAHVILDLNGYFAP
jgi:hypothetical protein